MSLPPGFLDELRSRVSISQVAGRKVIWDNRKSNQAKGDMWAPCPFHQEKTASFHVDDRKGFYYCFGCHAKGDAIGFVQETENVGFMEAIEILAREAGMQMPARDPQAAQKADRATELTKATEAAVAYFRLQLKTQGATEARAYLDRRGLDAVTLDRFEIGFAPDAWQGLWDALKAKGFADEVLLEAGLAKPSQKGGKPYDTFRNRIMFPIRDPRGRCIAFGGRAMDPNDGAKYLNSPETALFDKGRTLYNLDRAAPAARQSGRVIVVEGYMDVVALAQAGFPDAVAPLGTALTETQLEMLWRMVERPILCFDGDAAGQKAAMRAISRALPLLKPARTLGIVHLPAGLDPDDLVRQRGPQAMEALLAEPASLLDTLWEHERAAQPLASPEAKAGLKARLMTHVEAIADPDIRALYRRELLDRFSAFAFPPRPPRTARTGGSGRFPAAAPAPLSPGAREALRGLVNGGARHSFLAAVMAGFVRHPAEIARHVEALSRLARHDPKAAPAIESLIELSETLDSRGQSAISASQGIPAPPVDNRYAFLREGTTPDEAREELAEAVALLVERPALEAALAATIARFESDPEGSFAEQVRLREQLTTVDERLKAFGRRKAAPAAQGRGPAAAAGGSDETALAEDPSAAGEMD